MLSHELGRIIKEARLEKKMTQSEVVDDFITRNMLSQIESGTAFPSVKTLDYLAKKLDIPLTNLMNGDLDIEAVQNDLEKLLEGKMAFKAGNFKAAERSLAEIAVETSRFYDEAAAILARTKLALAKEEKASEKAVLCAKQAIVLADKGIYASKEIRTEAILFLDSLIQV